MTRLIDEVKAAHKMASEEEGRKARSDAAKKAAQTRAWNKTRDARVADLAKAIEANVKHNMTASEWNVKYYQKFDVDDAKAACSRVGMELQRLLYEAKCDGICAPTEGCYCKEICYGLRVRVPKEEERR